MGLHENQKTERETQPLKDFEGLDSVEEKSELDKIIARLQYMADYSGNIESEISNHLDVIGGTVPEPSDEPTAVQIDSKISDINHLLNIMDERIAGFSRSAHRLRTIA